MDQSELDVSLSLFGPKRISVLDRAVQTTSTMVSPMSNSTMFHGRNKQRKFNTVLAVCLAVLGFLWLLRWPSSYRSNDSATSISRPTVGKVTMIYGGNPVYERSLKTHEEHSRRLGYPTYVLRRNILDGMWSKIAYVLSLLLQEMEKPPDLRLEWLFWVDSDTVLLNPNIPLETFLPPSDFPDVHMLLTKDWNGMNAGVFMIRVHPWSIQLLSAAIAHPAQNPTVDLLWKEQSALTRLFKENNYFARSVVYCPLRWFNAYMGMPDVMNPSSSPMFRAQPGDLLIHFAGTSAEKLADAMEPYFAIAEKHQTEWQPPLQQTGHVKDAEMFWENMRHWQFGPLDQQ